MVEASGEQTEPGLEPKRVLGILVAYAILYSLGIRFGTFAYVAQNVSVFWPNAGLLVGFLLLSPTRYWGFFLAMSVLCDATVGGWFMGRSPVLGGLLGLVNCLEATVAVLVIRRFLGGRRVFASFAGVMAFTVLSLGVVSVGGLIGGAFLVGAYPGLDFGLVWRSWAGADGLGQIVVAPLVIAGPRLRTTAVAEGHSALELGAAIVLTTIAAILLMSFPLVGVAPVLLTLAFPVIWVALRYEFAWVVLLSAIIAAAAVVNTALGRGPFVHLGDDPIHHATSLQAFLVGMIIVMLSAGAALRERQKALEKLEEQRHELENVVASRTAELRRARDELQETNEDLHAFARTVGHDLRAPLRSVLAFGKGVAEERERLSPQAREDLERVLRNGERASAMLDGLILLSEVTHRQVRPTRVSVTHMAQAAIKELRLEHPERSVETEVEDEVYVNADPSLLQVVLENLLSNAWKFTRDETDATIRIASGDSRKPNLDCFEVADNGIGFDMRYREKLFLPFGRLHSTGEFDGNGIGLATVDRIIRLHGGSVEAEASPGAGAVFRVLLPATSG